MSFRTGTTLVHPGLLDESELWGRRDEPAIRRELVDRFLPYAKSVALRYRGQAESLDELIQVASLGLMKAIERYQPGPEAAFLSFASPTINGELKRHFRDRISMVRVPRGIYELIGRMNAAEKELRGQQLHNPTPEEFATVLGCSPSDVLEAQEAMRTRHSVTLAGSEDDDGATLEETLGTEDPAFRRTEERMIVSEAMHVLSQEDREIILMRYRDELSQSQIADQIGRSQMHVSRKIRQILNSLNDSFASGSEPMTRA